ncbi:RagB/SusD family nutrient uptake outer membrane protein [Chitinophagaceae bacterium LB-8]|uniref:RagB/SusD family nutrient uptake outer membrane protein n=1 Tax=Paraflavisolibacter caeni TaxID=2982496 RepID=A0A9X3BHI3_9BACT|nr:RagB/SusD family nutrient uptake outer membrane protein [Paraflavisolibacter caeni]MCU7548813.1 RagB/SusD family nutrient uptake outer membrane protein [Paraflavisolibacter caeni]
MIKRNFNTTSFQNKAISRHLLVVTIGVLLLMPGLTGCKKFLDIPPKDRVPQSILFNDEQGFKDAMIGVYLALDKPKSGGGSFGMYTQNLSMGMLSALAYNYDSTASSANIGNATFYNTVVRYIYADATVKAEIAGIWGGMYNTIANINNLLSQIDGKKQVFSGDNYYRVKGEAIGGRALLHLDLLRMFGPLPATGANLKAIPYVRRYDIRSTRLSTLNEALDSCIHDLNEAKSLLAQTDTSAILQGAHDLFAAYTQNHINYWTVEALLARAHLYKGNMDSANYYASAVIGSNKFPLISSNVAAANPADRLFSQEVLFSVYSANVKNYNAVFPVQSSGQPLMFRKTTKNALFTTGSGSVNDYRYTSWFNVNQTFTKYTQDDNLTYHLQNNVPVVRVSEMYYIAAEAANSKGDINTGVTMLNKVRQGRGLNALNANGISTTDSVSTEIMKEYQKEFLQEGQTFFYYKRLNKDLSKVTSSTVAIPANVYVFPLPDKELEYNH